VLIASDAGKKIRVTKATACSVTIPPNVSVPFPIGTVITLEAGGAGLVTVIPGSGVTLNSYLGATQLVGQYAVAGITKDAEDTWSLYGNISTP
jgi:hypothetical protein